MLVVFAQILYVRVYSHPFGTARLATVLPSLCRDKFEVVYRLVQVYRPKNVKHPISTPFFWRGDPEIWHTVL